MTDILREAIKWARLYTDPPYHQAEKMKALCDAAESTLPRTKMDTVWRVEYAEWSSIMATGLWMPRCEAFFCKEQADGRAVGLARVNGVRCIRVTGPHQQEVPV